MANVQAVSRERYGNQRWVRYTEFSFAAKDAVVPVTAQEMIKAVVAMPVGFAPTGDGFTPVVVMGFTQGQNLFVAPDGRWLGSYVPAAYRSYPFLMAQADNNQQVLCFDEDSGLLAEYSGEKFFEESGELAEPVQKVLNFLSQISGDTKNTAQMCNVLNKFELIQPWPISLSFESGEKQVNGIFRIDEQKLNALPSESFEELRQSGALIFAYCQLLSMQHIQFLPMLFEAHHKGAAGSKTELDLDFLNDNGTITFN